MHTCPQNFSLQTSLLNLCLTCEMKKLHFLTFFWKETFVLLKMFQPSLRIQFEGVDKNRTLCDPILENQPYRGITDFEIWPCKITTGVLGQK